MRKNIDNFTILISIEKQCFCILISQKNIFPFSKFNEQYNNKIFFFIKISGIAMKHVFLLIPLYIYMNIYIDQCVVQKCQYKFCPPLLYSNF